MLGSMQHRIGQETEAHLTGWLKQVRKEQLVNGDKRIQSEAYEGFESLSEKVNDLCHKFEDFMRAIRPIGSSSGLIATSRELRAAMKEVLKEFGSNSAEIWREFSLESGSIELPGKLKEVSKRESRLPEKMCDLAEHLGAFFNGLCDIPEFSDGRLTDALLEFYEWLLYRAECIASHLALGLVGPSTARQYISRVMREMGDYVTKVGSALSDFAHAGVASIRDAQEKAQTRLQNMSAVASFLSAVTATTLQYEMKRERLETVVDALWVSSLILSVASAINSQLAMHWRAAMYRSPRSALPFWVAICLDYVPLGCLVGAVLAFSAGLVVWTIAAELKLAVRIPTAVITCATLLVLFIIIIWEAMEWWRDKKAEQAPADVQPLARIRMHAIRYTRQLDVGEESTTGEEGDQSSKEAPTMARGLWGVWRVVRRVAGPRGTADGFNQQIHGFGRASAGRTIRFAIQLSQDERLCTGDLSEALGGDEGIQDEGATVLPDERPRAVTVVQRLRGAVECLRTDEYRHIRAFILAQNPKLPHPHHKLQRIQPVHRLQGFHPPGHDIHFSPDGKYLAASQLHGNVAIWPVGKFDGEAELVLPNSAGRFAWSPNSSCLIIIEKKGLSIWELGTCTVKGSYLTTDEITCVTWLQSSSDFIAVINNELRIYNTELQVGKYRSISDLPLRVHDVASIPQSPKEHILVLGTVRDEQSIEEYPAWPFTKTQVMKPKSARRECWLTIIELGDGKQRRSVAVAPILAKARHLCVSSNGQFALVSYRDGDPPELWRLRSQSGRPQLVFRGRFFAPQAPEKSSTSEGPTGHTVSGKARFCGESDKWVMATDGKSNIYIWDRVSRQLLHTLKRSQIEKKFDHLSSISTITSARKLHQGGLVVVSACTEGGVIIWEESDARAQSESE